MPEGLDSSDVSIVAIALAVAAASALCIGWIVRNGRPTPLGKVGTRWETHRGLMWVEIVLLGTLLASSLLGAGWFGMRAG
jgi:hypothetical protein